MATIRRSGSGWQVLIRRKNYVGPRSRTFLSRDLPNHGQMQSKRELKNWDKASKESIAVAVCNGAVYEPELKTK